ncbi:unnamed protein product [Camellia sinensis]
MVWEDLGCVWSGCMVLGVPCAWVAEWVLVAGDNDGAWSGGRTDFCVRHGGSKRCKSEGCGKSAQGSTDFCKAHGGGKRCLWGQPGSEFGQGDGLCNSFARRNTGLCTSHGALSAGQTRS